MTVEWKRMDKYYWQSTDGYRIAATRHVEKLTYSLYPPREAFVASGHYDTPEAARKAADDARSRH